MPIIGKSSHTFCNTISCGFLRWFFTSPVVAITNRSFYFGAPLSKPTRSTYHNQTVVSSMVMNSCIGCPYRDGPELWWLNERDSKKKNFCWWKLHRKWKQRRWHCNTGCTELSSFGIFVADGNAKDLQDANWCCSWRVRTIKKRWLYSTILRRE